MIWIEVLSRHRDVTTRFRIAGPEASIGRGYDNDVIVDDPYVAAQHLRIFRDETGQLVAEDMGSANGLFLDGGRSRQTRIVVDGSYPIRIGQTFLRIRETSHAVERERVARRERRIFPIALAAALGLAILGFDTIKVWLTQTSEPRASSYLTPLLVIAAAVLAWVGVWTLLTRIFSGHSRFLRNLIIAQVGILAFSVYDQGARFSAFAWTWSTASSYQYVAAWSIAALVTTLLATAIAVQTLQRSEAFSDSGRQNTARLLMPPALRLVPLRDESAFFGEIAKLKTTLDGDRTEARTDEAGR